MQVELTCGVNHPKANSKYFLYYFFRRYMTTRVMEVNDLPFEYNEALNGLFKRMEERPPPLFITKTEEGLRFGALEDMYFILTS